MSDRIRTEDNIPPLPEGDAPVVMSVADFRTCGGLQEVNRVQLHARGLDLTGVACVECGGEDENCTRCAGTGRDPELMVVVDHRRKGVLLPNLDPSVERTWYQMMTAHGDVRKKALESLKETNRFSYAMQIGWLLGRSRR